MTEPYDDPTLYDLRTADLREDLRLFVREAARCGEPVLELGCGTGRVALHLARRGFRVVGLELDPAMAAHARAKARAAGLGLPLVRADMRRFSFQPVFRLVFVAFASLHDLPDLAGWDECLRCARASLAPGGALVFDDRPPPLPGAGAGPEAFRLSDENGLAVDGWHEVAVDPRNRTTCGEVGYRVERSGGSWEELRFPFRGTWAEKPEVEEMLARAGFACVEVQGDYAGAGWRPGSPRTIFRATR